MFVRTTKPMTRHVRTLTVAVLQVFLVSACAFHSVRPQSVSAPSLQSDAFDRRVQIRMARQQLRDGTVDRDRAENEAADDLRFAARTGSKKARMESGAKARDLMIWGDTIERDFDRYEAARQQWQVDAALASRNATHEGKKVAGIESADWRQLKLTQHPAGRVNHLWINPSDDKRLVAGTDGDGLWKSDDEGASWSPTTSALGAISIERIAGSAASPQVLYAGTGSRRGHSQTQGMGILKSVDAGNTWSLLTSTTPACSSVQACATLPFEATHWRRIHGIDVSPTTPLIVIAATISGLWRSADGGLSWVQVKSAPARVYTGYVLVQFSDVYFNPLDSSKVIAITDEGTVYRSSDGGITWSAFTISSLPKSTGARIHYSRAFNGRVYVLGGNAAGGLEVHRSIDNGASWSLTAVVERSPGNPADASSLFFTGVLWVDPTDEKRLIAGSVRAYRSQNGGVTWAPFCCLWSDQTTVISTASYNGSTNKKIYFADDGGIYRFDDIDANFSSFSPTIAGNYETISYLDTGLAVTQNNVVAGISPGPVVTGNQDVGVQTYPITTSPSTPWKLSHPGDGTDVAVDPTAPSTFYATTQNAGHIYRSDDGGKTQTVLCSLYIAAQPPAIGTAPCVDSAPFSTRLALDPQDSKRMYVGGKSLWRSENAKSAVTPDWTKIFTAQPDDIGVRSISISPINPDHIWLVQRSNTGVRVLRTTNARAAAPIFSETSSLPKDCYPNVIKADQTDTNLAWLGCAGFYAKTLLKTVDGGATWKAVSGFPVMPVYAISQHPKNSNFVYVGTEFGLYTSENSGSNWSTASEGPGNIAVTSIAWYTSTEMLIGTYGRGTWMIASKPTKMMVEYRYAPLDYYFVTSRDTEKTILDATAGWARTGSSFTVLATGESGTKGITRYYFDKVARTGSRGSHFYTLVDAENASLTALNPTNVQKPLVPFSEGIDSYAYAPTVEGVGGSCAGGLVPVYRIFRGQSRFPDDPNHRFTTDLATYNSFVASGWDGEGVKFCVLPS